MLGSRSVFNVNIMFSDGKYVFGLLDAKPCRTIMKLHQKLSFGPETCEIEPKSEQWHVHEHPNLQVRTKPSRKDMSFLF